MRASGALAWCATLRERPREPLPTQRFPGNRWVFSAAAATALALVPLWSHVVLVGSGIQGVIAVFREVGLYPSDFYLALLAMVAVARPRALDPPSRWLAVGLTVLTGAALLSAVGSPDPLLTSGLAAQLAMLSLAWVGIRSLHVSRTVLVAALIASAAVQSGLAAAQLIAQQPLVPSYLQLPWLPADVAQGGTPVLLNPAGDRILRGFGTFPHPNVLGGYLALGLTCLPLLWERWPDRARQWWAVGAMLSIGLLATFSRASWLAALVGLGFGFSMTAPRGHHRWWLPAIILVGAVVAIALSPLEPIVAGRLLPFGPDGNALERGSIENRLALDSAALVEIADHWPHGAGGANYGQVALAEGHQEGWGEPVPNLPLLITAELGLPGVFAGVLIIFGTVRLLRAGCRLDVLMIGPFFALITLAMLDHYLWSMPLGRIIAWVPFALSAARPHNPVKISAFTRSHPPLEP